LEGEGKGAGGKVDIRQNRKHDLHTGEGNKFTQPRARRKLENQERSRRAGDQKIRKEKLVGETLVLGGRKN